jgi:ribosomal-protein-alanine N-acetyltransferase
MDELTRKSFSIDLARQSDAIDISRLSREYIEYGLPQRYTPKRILKAIEISNKNVVVARLHNTFAGFGIMTYYDDTANLDLIAVKRRFQRSGIGTDILRWLEKVALTAGIYDVSVQVRKINRGAIRFYEALGFEIYDEKAGYYQGKETGVLMAKNLIKTKNPT